MWSSIILIALLFIFFLKFTLASLTIYSRKLEITEKYLEKIKIKIIHNYTTPKTNIVGFLVFPSL